MELVLIKIRSDGYVYGNYALKNCELQSYDNLSCKLPKKKLKLACDAVLVHYIIKEFGQSPTYCDSFVQSITPQARIVKLYIYLQPTTYDLIDYNWNDRLYKMVRERCELDHTFSWLSTLGGAFSALGDYMEHCAQIAGKISYHQLQLGMRLGDPNLAARCRLYFALSLIQRHCFKLAKRVVYYEYCVAKNASVVDTRLIKMCQGIWSKLQYERQLYKKNRKVMLEKDKIE